jgi:NET1-associated nuclear protein 1 (U3 small nucleolar RNA-associated protein 17)
VLVIWQLDTNQQQYLPHLSTSICNIVISSSGSSYTLKLADNSVMMLSTNDLIAKAIIRGLSISKELGRKAVAVMNLSQPDQLLLATPSDLSLNSPSTFAMLQTFDLATSHEVSRQALVRNLATAVNIGPNGQRVLGPDVVQLQISQNGLWLATVDEWTPPDTDREPLDLHVNGSMSAGKTEVYLKFWSFQKDSKTWEMNTKVEGPHSAMPHSVLKLAFNPARAEFASAGRDGYLRIWRPMLRQRNGMPVKNEAGEPLYTWTCYRERQPNSLWPPGSQAKAESAALAYSEDGSAIAVSFAFSGRPRILHIVDSRTGAVNERGTEALLCPPGNVEMAFIGKRLLLLSDRLLVWDVVDTMLVCDPIILKEHFVQDNGRFLAANVFDRTFAVALNPANQSPAMMVVFDASQAGKILYHAKIHGHVKALLPSSKGPGYVVVDGEARIQELRPSDAKRESLNLAFGGKHEVLKGLNDIFGSSTNDAGMGSLMGDATPKIAHGEEANLLTDGSPKGLEDIFEQQAFSTPLPVSGLFEKVASLFRKAQ